MHECWLRLKESSKAVLGAVVGIVLAVISVSGLGYLSGPQQSSLYAAVPTSAERTAPQAGAQTKAVSDAATIQAVSQAGFSSNLVLILTFIIPLAFAITAYLVFKKR